MVWFPVIILFRDFRGGGNENLTGEKMTLTAYGIGRSMFFLGGGL